MKSVHNKIKRENERERKRENCDNVEKIWRRLTKIFMTTNVTREEIKCPEILFAFFTNELVSKYQAYILH